MSDDAPSEGSTEVLDQTELGELFKSIDVNELLSSVDLSKVLTRKNITQLLERVDLAAIGGQLGATVGRKLGAIVGRKLGMVVDSADRSEGAVESNEDEAEDSTADGGNEQDEAPVETLEDLEAMSYQELQSLAKDTDVKGNLSRDEMTEQLADEFDIEREE